MKLYESFSMYPCTASTLDDISAGVARFGSVGYGGRGRSFLPRIAAIAASISASAATAARASASELLPLDILGRFGNPVDIKTFLPAFLSYGIWD